MELPDHTPLEVRLDRCLEVRRVVIPRRLAHLGLVVSLSVRALLRFVLTALRAGNNKQQAQNEQKKSSHSRSSAFCVMRPPYYKNRLLSMLNKKKALRNSKCFYIIIYLYRDRPLRLPPLRLSLLRLPEKRLFPPDLPPELLRPKLRIGSPSLTNTLCLL